MQVASGQYLTPPQVAKRLAVDPCKVRAWIVSGSLRAVNLGDGRLRPRYRVSEADLAVFLAARSAGPEPKISRIRRRKNPNYIEYF